MKHAPCRNRTYNPVIKSFFLNYCSTMETEALGQALIIKIVRAWLDLLLPEPLEAVQEREKEQRAVIQRALEGD